MGLRVRQVAPLLSPENGKDDETLSSSTKLVVTLSAVLVGHEFATGSNILDWWGGAFEVASIKNRQFQKLSNVLHTIWTATKVNDRKWQISLVPKFIKYDYFEDILVAQTLDVSFKLNGTKLVAHLNEHAYRLYTPLIKSRRDYDLSKFNPPDFDHQTLCCYVLMAPRLPIGNLVHIYHSDAGDTPFKLIKSEQDNSGRERFRISYHDRLKHDIESKISQATGMDAEFNQIG